MEYLQLNRFYNFVLLKFCYLFQYYLKICYLSNILIDYLAHRGFNRNNIFHIPNMIKVTHDYKEKQYKKPLIIGSFGRFVAKKGFNYLIEAIALLKSQGHNIKLLLGVAGEEEPILRKLIKRLNLLRSNFKLDDNTVRRFR